MLVRIELSDRKMILQCDWCKIEYQRSYRKERSEQNRHYCCNRCLGLGSREKRAQTNIERYGDTNYMRTSIAKLNLKRTFQERYGVNAASQIPGSESKKILTCLRKHGVEYVMQNKDVNEKRKQTCLSRYGVDTALNTHHARTNAASLECQKKKHATMLRNGTYGSSKAEDKCYALLCKQFGIENIVKQFVVNDKWPIDFYVKNIDTYVQLDGVYWHGLDRPIEEIAKFTTKRDRQIYVKWLTDRDQDAWFKHNDLKLRRITDVEIQANELWLTHLSSKGIC